METVTKKKYCLDVREFELLLFVQADNKTSTCLIPHNVAEDKGRPRQNWICCMAVNTGCGTVYVGDSHGQLSMLQDGKVTVTKKVEFSRNMAVLIMTNEVWKKFTF